MPTERVLTDAEIDDCLLAVHGEDHCGCHRCARRVEALTIERVIKQVTSDPRLGKSPVAAEGGDGGSRPLTRQETSEGAEDGMADGRGSWDSVSPSPDGPEQSGAGSGARGAATARQSSDSLAQDEAPCSCPHLDGCVNVERR